MSNGKVTVKPTECGKALCEHIVGLKEPVYKDGSKKIDKYTPDGSLRNRPLMELALLRIVQEQRFQTGEVIPPLYGRSHPTFTSSQNPNRSFTCRIRGRGAS